MAAEIDWFMSCASVQKHKANVADEWTKKLRLISI